MQRGMKRTCLFKDLLGRIGIGNICLDEMSALLETLAEVISIHAHHAPAIGVKVTYRCASNSPSRASNENSFCHKINFFYTSDIAAVSLSLASSATAGRTCLQIYS